MNSILIISNLVSDPVGSLTEVPVISLSLCLPPCPPQDSIFLRAIALNVISQRLICRLFHHVLDSKMTLVIPVSSCSLSVSDLGFASNQQNMAHVTGFHFHECIMLYAILSSIL